MSSYRPRSQVSVFLSVHGEGGGGYPSLWSQVLSRGGDYPSLWSHILFQGSTGPFWGRKEGGTPVSGPRSLFQPLVPGHFWGEGVPQPLVPGPPGSSSGVSQSGARRGYPLPPARTRTGGTPQPGPGQRVPPGQNTTQTGYAAGSTPLAVTQEDFLVLFGEFKNLFLQNIDRNSIDLKFHSALQIFEVERLF